MKRGRYMVWRDGRPRWAPGASVRALGFAGQDLKDEHGQWLKFEAAIAAADEINARVDAVRASMQEPHDSEDPNSSEAILRRLNELQRSRASRIRKVEGKEDVARHRKGFIYFYWIGNTVKIGFSIKPLNRLRGLETGAAEPPSRILVLPGTLADERRLHKRFDRQRSHGEWFRATVALNQIIQQMFEAGTTDVP